MPKMTLYATDYSIDNEASLDFVSQIFLNFLFWNDYGQTHWKCQKQYKESLKSFVRFTNAPHWWFSFSIVHIKTPEDKYILNKHDKVALTFVFKGCGKAANY